MIKNILIASVLVLSISCGNSKRAQKKAMKEILPNLQQDHDNTK